MMCTNPELKEAPAVLPRWNYNTADKKPDRDISHLYLSESNSNIVTDEELQA